MRLVAKIISFLFHPLLLPTYAFAYVIGTNPDIFGDMFAFQAKKMYLLIFINTFIFPVATTFLLWRLGFVKSFYLEEKRERTLPYIGTGLFFTWSFIVFSRQDFASDVAMTSYGVLILNGVLLGATISVFASFLFNIFTKISMHTVGAGSFIGVGLLLLAGSSFNLLVPFSALILVAGLVGSARMKLGAHTPFQIYGGYLLGIICQLIAFQVL